MKLSIPPLEIKDDEGFTESKDIFQRKPFGEHLANLIEKSDGNLVLALDAPWGEGKSTFIKMWKGFIQHHRKKKIKVIHFDAFANDYQKDSFLALASEIYDLLKDEGDEKKKEFKKEAGKVVKALTRGALKIGVRSVSGGILDGSFVDGAEKDISGLIANQVDTVIAERLESSTKDKLALVEFREYLAVFAASESPDCPLLFIIDELDRCRPDFALELIEQIKHLFSVSGITFLLVMNRKQLEASVNKRYGQDIMSSTYLQKFVNLWLTLPRKIGDVDHSGQYVEFAFNEMLENDEKVLNTLAIQVVRGLVMLNQSNYREIEQTLSNFALVHNMADETEYNEQYQCLMAFVCYIKAAKNELFEEIIKSSISAKILIEESRLAKPDDDLEYNLVVLKEFIIFDLASDSKREQMIKDKQIHGIGFRVSNNAMRTICNWLVHMQTIS